MGAIENRMVVDSEWSSMEKEPKLSKGCFDRWGGFVHQEYLLEVAVDQAINDPITRDSFLDKLFDYIESDKEATEKFLKWFYPDYKEG